MTTWSPSPTIASITTTSARILGVQHRVGSLEVGKDCDLIVVDKDLLHYEAFVQWTVIDGKVVYDKQKELYFAHIRPRAEATLDLFMPSTGKQPALSFRPFGDPRKDDERRASRWRFPLPRNARRRSRRCRATHSSISKSIPWTSTART